MKTSDNKGGSPHRAADRREAAMSGEAERKDASAGGFNKLFGDIANRTSQAAGRALTFVMAVAVVVVRAVTGPVFQYSDTWQLVINTGTTIVTFLMVFQRTRRLKPPPANFARGRRRTSESYARSMPQ
jgi:hypothetical protein